MTEVSVHIFQASNFVDFIEFYTPHAYDIYAKNPYLKIDKCKSLHLLETRSNIQCLYESLTANPRGILEIVVNFPTYIQHYIYRYHNTIQLKLDQHMHVILRLIVI